MEETPQNTTQPEDANLPSTAHEQQPEKKFCILTKIACGCALSFIAFYVSINISVMNIDYGLDNVDIFRDTIARLLLLLFFASPFIAIASLIRINLNPDQLKGRVICTLSLLIPSFVLFVNGDIRRMAPRARYGYSPRTNCNVNLKGLGTGFQIYAYEHDDVLPSDNWCDLMIQELDVAPKSLVCPRSDSKEGESDYCLNIHAAGMKLSELPGDMVLLFECRFTPAESQIREPIKNRRSFSNLEIMHEYFTGEEEVYLNRWNQVAGPEVLAYDRHGGGCNILFVDGRSGYIQTKKLTKLKWDEEGTVRLTSEMMADIPIPQLHKQLFPLTQTTALLAILGSICVVIMLYVLIRYKTIPYLPFVLIIALLSTGTGMYFGNMSEEAYYSCFFDGTTGRDAGLFFGLLVGICFPVLLANAPDRIKTLRTFVGFAASVGMVTGIICSTLVHLALIIVNKETNFAGILIGIPYGIAAGAVLGVISGFILKKLYKPQNIETEIKSEGLA